MTRITFVTNESRAIEVTGRAGASLMETAVSNGVPGIEAECGGSCSCATCHVYVDEAWIDTVGRAGDMETDMLEMAYDVAETSRLSCQIKVSEALDGLVVRLPARQV